ncbi:glycoside hydrolase family 43 protein [Sphingomonas sp.]|uniref:glycoside hydrolase family 43 protein n=1 Tax=Sphingomonas sp. TaxID=28214 RepID=UPI0038B340C5
MFLNALAATAMLAATGAQAASVARFDWFEYRGNDHQPTPKRGEYGNPILQGFYPDPSMIRVGDDYYLVNSTFAWFPGIPVFHSRDLVNWSQIGSAIDRPGQLNFARMTMSQGVYAPDISWHDGTFYIVNTCVGCGGNFVISAKNPAGPWSDPAWIPVDGIDTSLFFDDDGTAWILNNGDPVGKPRYEGHRAIWLQQFDAKRLKPIGQRQVLVDSGVHPEEKPIWIEGPHILKKDGAYYLYAAEGGTAEGHSEVVFRSDKVTGPYVPAADNPILTQRDLPADRPSPVTSTGHASFVKTQRGDWWAVFLGVRPYDAAGNFNTGRETFLMPVRWKDGWPRITRPGERLPQVATGPNLPAGPKPPLPTRGTFTLRDEFGGARLAPYWMTLRNPDGKWWRTSGGALQIEARSARLGGLGNPSLIARRQQHLNASARTKVTFEPSGDAEAGLVALQNDEYWYFLAIGQEHGRLAIRVRRRAGGNEPAAGVILASASTGVPPTSPVQLRIDAHGAAYDFSWSTDGRRWHSLLRDADGTLLSTKRSGGFVGAVFGLYAYDAGGTP